MDNYYRILDLSIEKFESNTAVLEQTLEKKKNEWNSSNNTNIRSQVDKYYKSGVIKDAFSNSQTWKKIYEEAKEEVDESITQYLYVVSGKGYVTNEEIESCAKNKNVKTSIEYVRRTVHDLNITIAESRTSDNDMPEISLDNFAPESKIKFSAPAKELSKISCTDYYDFLSKYSEKIGKTALFTLEISPDKCVLMAQDIEAFFKSKKEDTKKSAVDKICVSIKHFNKSSDAENQQNYNKYLIWTKLKNVLDQIWQPLANSSVKEISEKVKGDKIKELMEFIPDKKVAEGLLLSFCNEKGITTPKKTNNFSLCIFCGNAFENGKRGVLQSCPICHRSFLLKCPVCGKTVNSSENGECCGFNFEKYPYVKKMCNEVRNYIHVLDLEFAQQRINDINNVWKDFPELEELRSEFDSKKKLLGDKISELKKYVAERKMYKARVKYSEIRKRIAEYSDQRIESIINSSIEKAEKIYKLSGHVTDPDEKMKSLMQVLLYASDHHAAKNEVESIPPKDITDLTASANQNASFIDISWKSEDVSGTVEFVIKRKRGGAPVSHEDGEEIARTTENAFSDNSFSPGEVYYYSVFAVRGNNQAAMHTTTGIVIFPDLKKYKLSRTEKKIEVEWNVDLKDLKAEVFRVESESDRDYTSGKRITVGERGFIDRDLLINKKYFYNIFMVFEEADKNRIISDVFSLSAGVRKLPEAVEISAEKNEESGDFDINIISKLSEDSEIVFYGSSHCNIFPGTSMRLSSLQNLGLKVIIPDKLSQTSYKLMLNKNEAFYLYVVSVDEEMCVAGNFVYIENFELIKVKNIRNDGISLFIELEKWPEGYEQIYYTYNNDHYPVDLNDCIFKKSVNHLNYKKTNIVINAVEKKNYYFSGFVKTPDGEKIIFKSFFQNAPKTDIIYYYTTTGIGFFKKRKLIINLSEKSVLPELSFRYSTGKMPIYDTDGIEGMTISASEKKKKYEFDILFKVRPGTKAKLFLKNKSDNEGYQLKLDPSHTADLT